jgi:hypothetical protein
MTLRLMARYGENDDTWEPVRNLAGSMKLLAAFRATATAQLHEDTDAGGSGKVATWQEECGIEELESNVVWSP